MNLGSKCQLKIKKQGLNAEKGLVKGILYLVFLLCAYSSLALAGPLKFPQIDFNKLTPKQKEFALRDLHHFIKEYEKKQLETYSAIESEKSDIWQLISEAYAVDPQNMCLYGGWPSERTSSGCIRPQLKNSTYKEKYGDKCEESELYCNPILFGHDLCIPFGTRDQRISAYQSCNRKFNQQGRTLAEVVEAADGGEFNELLSSAKNVCAFGKQAGTGMCQSLVRKFDSYTDFGTPLVVEQLIQASNSKDQDHSVQALNGAFDRMELLQDKFQKECGIDFVEKSQEEFDKAFEALPAHKQQECLDIYNELSELEHYVNNLLTTLEVEDPEFYKEVMCGVKQQPIIEAEVTNEIQDLAEEIDCLPEVAARKSGWKNCMRDISCAAISSFMTPFAIINDLAGKEDNECISGDNSCIVQALTGIIKNLTDLVTGLWDLAVMGVEYAGKKIKQGWNWLWNIEDKSADAQNAMAGLSGEDLNQLEKDPRAWYEKLWDGIKLSFKTFLKEHVGCEKWSGVPHYSQCLEPFTSFECMSCKTIITGTCFALGYIAPEIIAIVGTGGLSSLVKGGVTASKTILTAVKASSKFKTFTKAAKGSMVGRAYGKVASNTSKVISAGKTIVKGGMTKLKPIGQWGSNTLKSGLAKFMRSPAMLKTKKLMDKLANSKAVVVKQSGQIKKLVLKKKEQFIQSSFVQTGKGLVIKSKDYVSRTLDVEIDLMKRGANWVGKGYRKFERRVNDPMYRLSDNMVAGSQRLANRINPVATVSRVGTSVGVKGGTKALTLADMKKPYYPKSEIDDYFASFINKPNKRKFYGDFLHEIADKYPNFTAKQLDELKNIMYNIHKTCNPVWPSKVVTVCKKKMLVTFKNFMKEKYPKVDQAYIEPLWRADVRVLGEVTDDITGQLDLYAKHGSSFDSKLSGKARLTPDELKSLEVSDDAYMKVITSKNKIKDFSLDVKINDLSPEEFAQMEKYWVDYHNQISDVISAGKIEAKTMEKLEEIQDVIKSGPLYEFNHYRKSKNYSDKFGNLDEPELVDSGVDIAAKVDQEIIQNAGKAMEEINQRYRPDLFAKRLENSKKLPLDQRAQELSKLTQETVTNGGSENYASRVFSEFYSGSGKRKYGENGEYIPTDKIYNYDEIKNVNTAAKTELEEVSRIRQRLNVIDESYTKPNTYTQDDIKNIAQSAKDKIDEGLDPAEIVKYQKGSLEDKLSEQVQLKKQLSELKEMGDKGYFSDEMVKTMSGRSDMTVEQYIKNVEAKMKQAQDNIKMLETELDGL